MKSENMGQYIALKRRILTFTGVIISSGLVVAGATGGSEAAQAFALGGILAVAYQLALNRCSHNSLVSPPIAPAETVRFLLLDQ